MSLDILEARVSTRMSAFEYSSSSTTRRVCGSITAAYHCSPESRWPRLRTIVRYPYSGPNDEWLGYNSIFTFATMSTFIPAFSHLYLSDILVTFPLQEVDLFQELLLMVLELPHGAGGWVVQCPCTNDLFFSFFTKGVGKDLRSFILKGPGNFFKTFADQQQVGPGLDKVPEEAEETNTPAENCEDYRLARPSLPSFSRRYRRVIPGENHNIIVSYNPCKTIFKIFL